MPEKQDNLILSGQTHSLINGSVHHIVTRSMRPCKSKIILGVVLLLLVAGAAFYMSRDNNPVFEGKRLSRHLEAFGANGISFGSVSGDGFVSVPGVRPHCSDQHAGEALEKVGTNALPMLVQMLKSQ